MLRLLTKNMWLKFTKCSRACYLLMIIITRFSREWILGYLPNSLTTSCLCVVQTSILVPLVWIFLHEWVALWIGWMSCTRLSLQTLRVRFYRTLKVILLSLVSKISVTIIPFLWMYNKGISSNVKFSSLLLWIFSLF